VNLANDSWAQDLAPYYPKYDRSWAACQDDDMSIHLHSGSAGSDCGTMGSVRSASSAAHLAECLLDSPVSWSCHRCFRRSASLRRTERPFGAVLHRSQVVMRTDGRD
jgi:hypothetical protein